MSMFHLKLASRRHTRRFATALSKQVGPGDLVILEGGLGAGKTFLVRGLLRGLDVPSQVPVNSPTFALVHEYEARCPVWHLDLYRLHDARELEELGLREISQSHLVLVEWGARFAESLGSDRLEIQLAPILPKGRSVHLQATGLRSEAIVEALRHDVNLATFWTSGT